MPLEPDKILELLGKKRENAEDELLEALDDTQQDIVEVEKMLVELKTRRLKYIMDCVALDIPQHIIAEVLHLPPRMVSRWVNEVRATERQATREHLLKMGLDPDRLGY